MPKRIYMFYHPLYVPPTRDLNAVNELAEKRKNNKLKLKENETK
jgi:hypothetical protein